MFITIGCNQWEGQDILFNFFSGQTSCCIRKSCVLKDQDQLNLSSLFQHPTSVKQYFLSKVNAVFALNSMKNLETYIMCI